MKELQIIRFMSHDDGTFGTFLLPERRLFTAELPWRDNQPNVSCIPAGEYYAVWSPSVSKGWGYELIDVPGRTEVRIHIGNWSGDVTKKLKSDVKGCIVLGGNIVQDGHGQKMVTDSADSIKYFHDWAEKQILRLTIVDAYL